MIIVVIQLCLNRIADLGIPYRLEWLVPPLKYLTLFRLHILLIPNLIQDSLIISVFYFGLEKERNRLRSTEVGHSRLGIYLLPPPPIDITDKDKIIGSIRQLPDLNMSWFAPVYSGFVQR